MGHWSDIKNDEWHWPNFTPKEIACRGTGELVVVSDAMDRLQTLRELLDRPLHITSAYRSRLHNARIGGVSLSRHRGLGGELAFDILIKGLNKWELLENAKEVGFGGFGYYNSFLHIDTRRRYAEWASWI